MVVIQMKKPALMLGPVEITRNAETPKRMAILLWGPAGVGKTTFAGTAPGDKLWLSFGDQEHASVGHRKDVLVANYADMGYEDLFKYGQNDNPFGLDALLSENENIETVVCDSVTAIAFRALQKAVDLGLGGNNKFRPTMEAPGLNSYGARNAIVLEVLTGLLRITAKHGVHLILTAHEADPVLDTEGAVQFVTIMLGGKLVNNNTWRLSEIWWLNEDNNKRFLAVRPTRKRRPMKTRMFSGKGAPEFELKYDADAPDKGQMTIASFYDEWVKTGEKLPVPERRVK
jgi:hypothetical protein